MFPFNRMQNIFQPKPRLKSNNPLFDEFLASIAPLMSEKDLKGENLEKLRFDTGLKEKEKDRQFDRDRYNVTQQNRMAEIFNNQQQQPIEQPQPMNTVFRQDINPYQQGVLDLRGRELENKMRLGEDSIDLRTRAQIEDELKNKNTLDLNTKKIDEIERRNKQKETDTMSDTEKVTARDNSARNATELQFQLKRELIALQGDQSLRAINRRGEIQKELVALGGEQTRETNAAKPIKPETSTGTKQRILNQAREAVARNPEWANYLTIDEDGNIKVADVSEPGIISNGFSKKLRDEIVNAIYGSSTKITEPPTDDTVTVLLSDGVTKKRIPKSALAEALKRGAKQVQ